jgi:hypothetical protein
MKPTVTFLAALLLVGAAEAGDVYVTKDAKGNPIYTDTPLTIPAEKLDIHTTSTNPADVQKRYTDQMKQYAQDDKADGTASSQQSNAAKPGELTTEDRAKRCADARQRYQSVMEAQHLYEDGPNGERSYLSNDQIDVARANAKQVMDEFCSGQ